MRAAYGRTVAVHHWCARTVQLRENSSAETGRRGSSQALAQPMKSAMSMTLLAISPRRFFLLMAMRRSA